MPSFLLQRSVQVRLILVIGVFAAGGFLCAHLMPRWYQSVVTVVATKQQRPGVSSLLGGDLAALTAGFESSLGGADVQRISAVMQSIDLSDSVIERFHLKERYHETYQELARADLWEHCSVKVLTKPGLVQLTCEDTDPKFAQEMVQFFASHGNDIFRRVNASSASEEVRFLEKRVAQLRTGADEAAAGMRAFQEEHGIVDLDSQSKALVVALSTLNTQRINKRLELDYARAFSAGDESTLQQLSSQLSVMDQQMRDLQLSAQKEQPGPLVSARGAKGGARVFPAALEVPKLRAEYEKLYRDRKVAEATLIVALERLESARANEARDTSTFVVLDPPTLATRHIRPKRVYGLFIGTFVGALLALGYEWARSLGGIKQVASLVREKIERKATSKSPA